MNSELESHEQIKGVLMINDPWSIENGILTPTLKIKRHVLEQKYHDVGQNWPVLSNIVVLLFENMALNFECRC